MGIVIGLTPFRLGWRQQIYAAFLIKAGAAVLSINACIVRVFGLSLGMSKDQDGGKLL